MFDIYNTFLRKRRCKGEKRKWERENNREF